MDAKKIYAPGSEVKIGNGKIDAFINCVTLYAHGGVLYEVVWWNEGSRDVAWVNDREIGGDTLKVPVGFK